MMISVSSKVENIVGKGENAGYQHSALPGWLSGEHVGLMTWWLRV